MNWTGFRSDDKQDGSARWTPFINQIYKVFTIVRIGSTEIALTNSAIYMIVAVAVICAFLILSTRSKALVPGRFQAVAEMLYEFVADMLRETAGPEAMVFFPLVFALFSFILVANVIGLIPHGFTVTSHIIITAALALLVFFTVLIAGFWKHGCCVQRHAVLLEELSLVDRKCRTLQL
jgi:F-type H+-transporting ATPase subunit a